MYSIYITTFSAITELYCCCNMFFFLFQNFYVSIHFKCPHRFNSKGDQFTFCHLSQSSFSNLFPSLSLMWNFLLSSAPNSQCSECLTSRFDHVLCSCSCLCHRYATNNEKKKHANINEMLAHFSPFLYI